MSESSKMGLFGSKDKTKEPKKETSGKVDERYAPYCIDSDSETYDTEALSIMDINDIIGVQSEQVGDSTLESEIAALSEIITESKTDGDSLLLDSQCDITDVNLSEDQECFGIESLESIGSMSEHLKGGQGLPGVFSAVQDATSACSNEQLRLEKLSVDDELNALENMESNSCANDARTVLEDVCESNVCVEPSTKSIIDESSSESSRTLVQNVNILSEINAERSESTSILPLEDTHPSPKNEKMETSALESTEDIVHETESRDIEISNRKNEERAVELTNEVSSSLQLIGEAYTSEDSQETIINETDTLEENVQIPANEDPLLQDEQKPEIIEPIPEETSSELQEDLNKPLDAPENISTVETRVDGNIPIISMEVEPEATEADRLEDAEVPKTEVELPDTTNAAEEEVSTGDNNVAPPSEIDQSVEESKGNIDASPTVPETVSSDSPIDEELTDPTTEETIMATESVLESKEEATDSHMDVQVEKQAEICERSNAEKIAVEENLQSENVEKPEKTKNATTLEQEKPDISEVEHDVSNEDMQLDRDLPKNERLNEDPEVNEEMVQHAQTTDCAPTIPETTESSTLPEPEKMDVDTESLDTIDNCNIPINASDVLGNLPVESKMINERVEEEQDVAGDSLKTLLAESNTETMDVPDKSTEIESRDEKEEEEEKAVPNTEETLDDTSTITDDTVANVEQSSSGVEDNKEPEPTSEMDTDELESEEPSTEVSTAAQETDDSPEQCSTATTETVADTEISSEAENEAIGLNPISSDPQSITAAGNAVPMDIGAAKEEPGEAETVEKMDTSSENNVKEPCDIEPTELDTEKCSEKIEEAPIEEVGVPSQEIEVPSKETEKLPAEIQVPSEEAEKLPEEIEKTFDEIEKTPIIEDTTNIMDTSKTDVEEEKPSVEKETNVNINAAIEEETDTQESNKIEEEPSPIVAMDEEESIDKIIPTISQTTDLENINDSDNKNAMEESAATEYNDKIIPEIQSDVKENETVDDTDKKEIPEVTETDKNAFSPTPEHADIVIPEEDAEEEHMEEEMNLTLDPEESEMQLEAETKNAGSTSSPFDLPDVTEKEKEPAETDNETEINPMETFKNDACVEMTDVEKPDDVDTNLENVACSSDVGLPMLSKDPEGLEEKQDLEDSLQNEVENNNLKSILESANNVVDMFSEEQCQNTQDIVTSILEDDSNVTDFKNILETGVGNEIRDVLQRSADMAEAEIKKLTEKLPQSSEDILNKDMEDSMASQNMDSLEGLLGLDLMPDGEDSTLKTTKSEETEEERQTQESLEKEVDMVLLLGQSNRPSDITQASDYISDVISSCLKNANDVSLKNNKDIIPESLNDKTDDTEANEILKASETIMSESMSKDDNVVDIHKHLQVGADLPENDLDMDFEANTLESVADLEEGESKLDLAPDLLLQNDDQSESLNDATAGLETSQPSSEISELESAVKFLQESEEQAIDSPLVLSPKLVESVVEDISKQANASSLFVPDEDICEDASELVAELQDIATDSISISEAEIISEAAKLESERKLAQQVKIDASSIAEFARDGMKLSMDEVKGIVRTKTEDKLAMNKLANIELQGAANVGPEKMPATIAALSQNVMKVSETIPKISILEERLKEPPKIEIPTTDVTKVSISPSTSKDSLLIQKDAKMLAYQKMLESPKLLDKGEPKIMDTPRKDSEKHEFENVGSPRIILKIAKSAIADCSEPRSPKSPKIRSATNSPNPEDSPGQKLGKIKLKLSKSGHPSIISNENVEEAAQWHSEGSASLSPLGMKIKLSKSGDASIVSSEKHETMDDAKEPKHKFEEAKRTESPIGMKIKLSKSGDASIVQQDSKDIAVKHKDKLDIVQGSPKRTESPIGMKIKLSKSGDASIIQPERQEMAEDYKDNTAKTKEKVDMCYGSPKRTDSPIGMKIKLSKTGDASIVSPDVSEEGKETSSKLKEKLESSPDIPKRTESPIGMKIKLTKTKGGASIISVENTEDQKEKSEVLDIPKRTESPLGMKIKLSKSGDASIIHSEVSDEPKDAKQKEKPDSKDRIEQDIAKSSDLSSSMKIKVMKMSETSMIAQESTDDSESAQETLQKVESPIGMKIKLSKFGDASIIPTDQQEQTDEHRSREAMQDVPKRTESPIGMKIKLSKTGDASIIQTETPPDDPNKGMRGVETEHGKGMDPSLGMKIKLLKTGDASIVESEKKERQPRRRETESPLEMKIKLSKTGHPTIVACDSHAETMQKPKDMLEPSHNFAHRYKEPMLHKEPALKILKAGHSTILQSNRSELTIEPVQMQSKKMDSAIDISPKRKEITISPIEPKKSKLETQLSQILPEVTIQPVMSRDQKQLLFDPKKSLISRQQMNVISQEISITQVRPSKSMDTSMSEKLKDILSKNISGSPMGSDCEIIEHRPELIIVNENSNSSQDVMIIEEVPSNRMPEVKVPKKRGRPRRNPLPQPIPIIHPPPPQLLVPRDPLALDEVPQAVQFEHRENERPKRTCRNQKSYAPPKRGRGRGRGKRKLDSLDLHLAKKPRIDQDLSSIEASTMAVLTMDKPPGQPETLSKTSELYKALKQPPIDCKLASPACKLEKKCLGHKDVVRALDVSNSALADPLLVARVETGKLPDGQGDSSKIMPKPTALDAKDNMKDKRTSTESVTEKVQKTVGRPEERVEKGVEGKDMLVPPGHPNWLTPAVKRPENVSTVQVIDEETRMSAESGSRSQTPARNISVQASENIINEESQGSVLSTATTESEKVKVKNRRMEINFDPDEGPFTVDKIAEYEWPLDRKGETFMIQEQISQYLGVKSFKRKYPDLKRRMVDMEERNYLRENGLVSEAMCDMGLTAVCSSEVLDVMCSDFPDQYEEYRKHMREKQIKEHSKKQKELTAAANAEKNRIDLAEMAVQSALSWNINLNKSRKENRKCSLDLQTFTIHVPKKQQKVELDRKVSHYPVALIPGQYTDYYREYTAAELRYYPLNTVLYGPMRPNERKFDSQSEGSQSDSDSDSSSDDSSSSSSEGTQDTEGSQSTMDEVDMEIVNQKDEIKLKCKMCLKTLNKHNKNEVLIQCGTCNGNVHPSCIDLTLDMVPHIQSYAWQCTDCKTCAQCHDPADEDKMLFCDMCDRGYHIYCVGLRRVPQGRWHCQECAVCANCGSREPGGINSDRNSVAQWQHEYKKGDKNTRVYVSTLCVPCSKLWRKGRYCPHCSRCHTAPRLDLEANLVHCSACDKYLHLGCVETKGVPGFDRKNYLCDFCTPNRQHVMKPLVSKIFKT